VRSVLPFASLLFVAASLLAFGGERRSPVTPDSNDTSAFGAVEERPDISPDADVGELADEDDEPADEDESGLVDRPDGGTRAPPRGGIVGQNKKREKHIE